MNGEQLLYAVSGIRDDFIREASPAAPVKHRHIRRWAAGLAACLALALIAVWPKGPGSAAPGCDGAPSVVVDGVTYLESGYFEHSLECPEGFTLAGDVKLEGYSDPCPYYTSPDHPEWVYVYQWCYDQRTREYYQAYVRYVTEPLRGTDLLRYQDRLYIFLNDAAYLHYTAEVAPEDQARYDSVPYSAVTDRLPSGFVPVGNAVFDGHDAVPTSELGSNTRQCRELVLADPDQPDLLLVRWYANGGEEEYWVYVRLGGELQSS